MGMRLQVLELKDLSAIVEELRSLKVHPGGIDIMAPKGILRIIKVKGIDSAALNILKQEMLSVGGDCAIPWDAFVNRRRLSEGVILGTQAQIDRLCEKLGEQPFDLPELGRRIRALQINYEKDDFVLSAGKYRLSLGERAYIMGILNVAPDSFFDGGIYSDKDKAVEHAIEMESQGADIIDIGGESTRPGAKAISAKAESERVIPVIKILAKRLRIPISIDTSKSQVAQKALDCGAVVVNDVTGLRKDPNLVKLAKKYKAAIILMHMKGTPRTMQKNPQYKSLIYEITEGLRTSIRIAKEAAIADDAIVIDPGIGFGKTTLHNLKILKRLREFKSLGYPVLVGPSRKSFIGKILGLEAGERIAGTAASVAVAIQNGANIVRVHDVRQMREVARLTDAILRC